MDPENIVPQTPSVTENQLPTASPKGRLFLGLFGFVFMIIGIYFISSTLIFMSHAVETTGTIIGNKQITSVSNHRTVHQYCPQATFGVAEQTYEFTSNTCSDFSYTSGSQVEILYDPQNPADARIKTPVQWLMPIIFLLLGALTFFAALFNKIKMGS